MAKTRLIPVRDTTVRPANEMLRRLAFVVYVLGGTGGLIALIAGLARKHPPLAIAGAVALGISVALHLTRHRWRAADIADEIAKNPFKPKRVPKDTPTPPNGEA